MASATRLGSSVSYSGGLPVATAQKEQERVQTFPKIIKVAVPAPQHSPILGQLPLSQMVWSLCSSTSFLTLAYSFPMGSLTRSQSGFLRRVASSDITGNSIIAVGFVAKVNQAGPNPNSIIYGSRKRR